MLASPLLLWLVPLEREEIQGTIDTENKAYTEIVTSDLILSYRRYRHLCHRETFR